MSSGNSIHNVVLKTSVSRLDGDFFESVRLLRQKIAVIGTEVTWSQDVLDQNESGQMRLVTSDARAIVVAQQVNYGVGACATD